MSNKLATIQRVASVLPHDNADSLELIKVLGRTVVAKKGEFKEGDLCVYVALDSILPERPEFEFLRNKQFRVKTIKLRGVVSQGICFPLSVLDRLEEVEDEGVTWTVPVRPLVTEGDDVTEALEVLKYEKPAPQSADAIGHFPTHLVSKTDEERIQNLPSLIEKIQGKEVYISVKHDGTSATYIMEDNHFRICSRNMELKIDGGVYGRMALKYSLAALPDNCVVQGEIVGPGIQNNREGLKEPEFRVFNVFDIEEDYTLNYRQTKKFCEEYELTMVDLCYLGPADEECPTWTLEGLLELADETKYANGSRAEGIVVRLANGGGWNEVLGKPLSFKVISNKYALKHGE